MGRVLQKRPACYTRGRLERVQIDVHDDDLAAFEALAHALNSDDETSERLRSEIERLLAGEQSFGAEEALMAEFRMTTRH
jgi:hypothetical protein